MSAALFEQLRVLCIAGVAATDHIKENMRRIRQIERNSAREQQPVRPVSVARQVPEVGQNAKYSHVQSRLLSMNATRNHLYRSKSACSLNQDGYEAEEFGNDDAEGSVPRLNMTKRPASSRSRSVNYVSKNIQQLETNARNSSTSVSRAASAKTLDRVVERRKALLAPKHDPGQVPRYLIDDKNRRLQEEEYVRNNQRDPEQPPGYRKLPESERTEALELLKKNQRILIQQLGTLPLQCETVRQKQRKQEIEKRLSEVDEAIRIFSKNKVFVKA